MFKLILEKAEKPEIKLPTSIGSQKKQDNFRKTSISASLTIPKPFIVWITTNWKILQEMGIQEKSVQIRKQQLESDVEQWTVSKLGK